MKVITAPPKTQQVVDYLKEEIRKGRIKPGERLDSIRNLAERFGVGRQVVLSAFNRLEEEGILAKHVGRGSFVRSTPLTRNGKLRIAFYVHISGLAWFYNRSVFLGCAIGADENGMDLMLVPGNNNPDPARWCRESGADGLLVTGQVDDRLAKQLNASGLPYLILGTYDLKEPVNILTSRSEAFSQALEKAFDRGVRRPGAILGSLEFYSTRNLLDIMKRKTAQREISIMPEHLYCTIEEDGYLGMKELMDRPEPPDMLVITGRAFPGAARYLFETGIRRPLIISAITDEGMPLYPELIDLPLPLNGQQTGRAAIPLLAELIRTGHLPQRINYLSELPEKQS